ncbi:UNVERIFIED_CONTAM: hypothetical protein PYX00_010070 [Menopon gallinae]|uniref:Uncharacterized protein n=1 Tax=Menopon gallinae TaxID=328185 RepID=A0AAW2HDV7_9NEOP
MYKPEIILESKFEKMEPFSDSWRFRSNAVDEATNSSQGHQLLAQNALKHSKPAEKRKSTPQDDGKGEILEAILDRRMTFHCIVEEITSLDEDSWKECPHNCGNGAKATKENNKWWFCECRNIERNSCVVLRASTCMSDLVKTALAKLGYPSNASSSAMGSILIRNWKALPLSTICPNPKMTVGDVLGELSSLVTLQIQILRPKSAFFQEIKDRLLSFLIAKSHIFLSNSGCPLDLLMLTKLCEESAYMRKHTKEEIQQRFEAWLNHVQKSDVFDREMNTYSALSLSNNENNNNISNNVKSSGNADGKMNRDAKSDAGNGSSCAANGESASQVPSDGEYAKESENRLGKSGSPCFDMTERSDRSIHCSQTKTRMRTSFDPDLELPKLLKWYLENPHPTRQQIHEYVQELNSLESRRRKKKLDMNNVVYWFKNARAAQKRSEYRKFCNIPSSGTKKNCNVLKIPLGKTSSTVASDEHIALSDDEPSVASENNTFSNEKGKCMQVLGSWNSNGAGEAVLEMQITPPKPESPIKVEEEHLSEHDESSTEGMLSIAEDSVDNAHSADENRSGEMNDAERTFDRTSSGENEKEFKFRKCESPRSVEEKPPNHEKELEDEICETKSRDKSSLIPQKKLNGFNHCDSSLLSRYKSGFS